MMKLSSYDGNPYVGVYSTANESFSLVPLDSTESFLKELSQALEVKVRRTSIAGTNILGSLMAVNSYGAVVSAMASDEEIAVIEELVHVERLDDKLNAAGNNILVNDHAALVNPRLSKRAVEGLEDTLQVEVVRGTVAGVNTVGSSCVVTNKGILCHPKTDEDELKDLSSLFKVPSTIGTLNYGAALVGACMIANTKGAAIGSKSTPIELGRVEDALGFI
jgi:translation initiation factor 6